MRQRKLQWISFEGGEGSGKTTLIKALCEELKGRGHQVWTSREPGGVSIAEKIRDVILDPAHTAMDPRCEALLYAASRRQHLVEKVFPLFEEEGFLLMDRFVDSSIVYQGYARAIGPEEIRKLNTFAHEGELPTRTYYLDLSVQRAKERVASREEMDNRLDLEGDQFHEKVRKAYLQLAKEDPKFLVLDASCCVEELLGEVLEDLKKKSFL